MRTRFYAEELQKLTRAELYELTQKLGVTVRKNNTREKLIEALLAHAQTAEKNKIVKSKSSTRPAKDATKTAVPKKAVVKKESKTSEAKTPVKSDKKSVPVVSDESASVAKTPAKKRGRPAKKQADSASVPAKTKPVAETKITRKTTVKTKTSTKAESDKIAKTPVVAKKTAEKKEAKASKAKAPAKADKKSVPVGSDESATVAKTPAKKRGRPAKKQADSPAIPVKAKESKPVSADTPVKRRPGRPAKSVEPKPVATAETPPAKKRGRPPKKALTSPIITEKAQKSADKKPLHVSDAAAKGLSRSFAKKTDDMPPARIKKGAEVLKDGVAIPVEFGNNNQSPSKKARQIENERSRRYSSLKTTMEVPIFQPISAIESASIISEDDLTGELPLEYGETRIVMQIRDPHWAYAYWEIPRIELKRLELEVGIFEFAHSHFVLRLHNVSEGFSQEIKLSDHAHNWHLYLESPQTVYQVELGMRSPAEGYSFIALSNLIQTPPDRVAERWAAPVLPEPEPKPEIPDRIGGHEFVAIPEQAPGIPQLTAPDYVYFTSAAGAAILHPGSSDLLAGQPLLPTDRPVAEVPFIPGGISSLDMPGSLSLPGSHVLPGSYTMPTSPAPSSAGWSSPGAGSFSGRLQAAEDDDIFLIAAVEVIVYGQVKVGCDLSFQGRPLRVRTDGSFSLRMALPFDSGHSIDLVATDPRTGKTRVIKAAVSLKKV